MPKKTIEKYLYPKFEPYEKGFLKTNDGPHEIYYEVSGNPEGIPVLYVHGGPGGGANRDSRRLFDPKVYKIILFDQRGCGESKPSLSLANNTTWHLIEDMELLRKHCHVSKWVLLGGSWGSTLSLCYAISHPDKVLHLILRGVFLATKQDLIWLYQEGTNYFNPIDFERYINLVPQDKRSDVISYYHSLMHSDNPALKEQALIEWARWESINSKIKNATFDEKDIKAIREIALIENHYFYNNCFFEENYIMNNISKIQDISTYIVHGSHDLICWPYGAYVLHNQLNDSKLFYIKDAGHSQWEDSILKKLIECTKKVAQKLLDKK
ncbi:prolyl aminopeptidase [Mycoplasmopsis primatum]|uniref:prolyl aminopeptidase n=1 Tax=Mycoplasmopsis primatum TaxID=55604 RepID=UPI000495E284|nr:prolyl aminopeptidase [Mycoplasmopsis primatum]